MLLEDASKYSLIIRSSVVVCWVLNIFEITKNDLNADNLQKIVNNKIQQIKSSDDSELPESKIDLIDFYYKISISKFFAFFKKIN